MFKSIFSKQFMLYMSALIISFAILGAVMWAMFGNYFETQKSRMLTEQAGRVAKAFQTDMFGGLYYDRAKLTNEILVLHDYLESSFIYVNNEKKIELATADISEHIGKTLSANEFDAVFEGESVTLTGRVGGIFSANVLTVARPVFIGAEIYGAVFLCSSMSELEDSASEMFRLTLLSLLASSAIAFVLIFIFSKSISRPLQEMNEAAKVIASGDFEKRLTVSTADEIGQLAESFNNMAKSLDEQEQLRRIFIGNVSHDLRSPLTSIRGFLQAILDGTITPDKQDYYLRVVMDETERLSKLTHEIIDLNSIQSEDVVLDKSVFDINELIRKTVLLFESVALNKNMLVQLNFAGEITNVFADYEKIQRVIYNLLDNAIKFSGENSLVVVETTLSQKKVVISVKDNGIGINSEDEKHIFERFYKADTSRGQDKTGSGLGLSIVSVFIKAHDESVTVKTKEGEGSEFAFALPLVK